MSRDLRPVRPISAAGLPKALHSGFLINRTPEPIPLEVYSLCGLSAMHDGKVIVMVFEPQHTTDVDEAIGLFQLLFSMLTPKRGLLAWETVPENLRRHFRFQKGTTADNPPAV